MRGGQMSFVIPTSEENNPEFDDSDSDPTGA